MLKYFFILIFCIPLFASKLITPLPLNPSYNKAKALLGKKLFFDKRLSKDNTISCASCHDLLNGGDDNLSLSFGVDGKVGTRNSPTVYNARYNFRQFWDGSAKDLKEQISGPIHNPVEMDSDFKQIISKLKKDKYYVEEFSKLYKNGINKEAILDSIVEFENALVTPNSRFDKYLRGDKKALNTKEIEGYKLFKEYGCISCHNGINIGGNLFQKIGIIKINSIKRKDLGRYLITKDKFHMYYFKVPTLRNIELTAPYLHDGSLNDLKSVIKFMALNQVGININQDEIQKIIKFLKTLNGEIPNIVGEK